MSVTLASISVAILAYVIVCVRIHGWLCINNPPHPPTITPNPPPNSFADHNEFSQIYGFIILPVAIAFCIYALRTYVRRSVCPVPSFLTSPPLTNPSPL